MYDKELFARICEVRCTADELGAFVKGLAQKEFDTDAPFDRYYSLDSILFAIRRYERQEIDDKYLVRWACAYLWILSGGFKKKFNADVTFQKWLKWKIVDVLDSLSFFDYTGEEKDLQPYTIAFKTLDKVYTTYPCWETAIAQKNGTWDSEYDAVVLAFCSRTKEFIKIHGDFDFSRPKTTIPLVNIEDLKKEEERLCSCGYQKLQYDWDINEEDWDIYEEE